MHRYLRLTLALGSILAGLAGAGRHAFADSVGAVHTVAGTNYLVGTACSSSIVCYALGQSSADEGVIVQTIPGQPDRVWAVAGTSIFYGISCPAATTCYAVGQNSSFNGGVVVSIDHNGPGTTQAAAGTGDSLHRQPGPRQRPGHVPLARRRFHRCGWI